MSSIQHPPHSAVLLTGITITFCALRAAQMGRGVPETTGFGGYKGTDIILHLLTLPAESIHHACLWGWSLSLSFIFFPPAGFFTADKGKRLMKEVTFHSPYLLIASLCCWAAPDRNTMQATSHFKDTRQSPRLWSKDHRSPYTVCFALTTSGDFRCVRRLGSGGLRMCQNENLNNVFEWTI